jgi:hypothetical protein
MVLSLIVSVPRFQIPPPSPTVLFLLIVVLLIVIPPPLNMAPPLRLELLWKRLLLLIVSVPLLLTPPPSKPEPLRIVTPARVTRGVALGIATTVLTPPPSTIVVVAPDPITFRLKPMVRFSV